MMNVCGSNLFPICITILCCAGLFMYFNLRLAEIKFSVEKQNRVLTAFITNVQQDIRGGCVLNDPPTNFATPEALAAAKKIATNDKIVVSDEEEDSDEENDIESISSDSDDEDNTFDEKKNIKIVNIAKQEVPIPIMFEVLSCVVNNDSINNGANESSITEIIDAIPLATEPTSFEPTSFEQMKVDELRKVVADKNLASKDEVKKLKKPELLVLLKK